MKRTFSLPEEQAAFISRKVALGGYGSASEVVRAGLRALQEHDAVIERWLREEVVVTYDEAQADPGQLIPVENVFAELTERSSQRMRLKK